jgi:hypothetical protein
MGVAASNSAETPAFTAAAPVMELPALLVTQVLHHLGRHSPTQPAAPPIFTPGAVGERLAPRAPGDPANAGGLRPLAGCLLGGSRDNRYGRHLF